MISVSTSSDSGGKTKLTASKVMNPPVSLSIIFVVVESWLVWAIFKYRRDDVKPGDALPDQTHGNTGLEIGLTAATTLGAGADVPVQGDVLIEFPRDTDSPARIQVSGQGTISVLAGGRTS